MVLCFSVSAEQTRRQDLLLMLEHTEPHMRMEAVAQLVEDNLVNDDVLARLVDLLDDPDYNVAQAAVRALTAAGITAVPKLATGLLKFSDPMKITVRQSIVRILGEIGGEDSIELLADVLKDSASQVRRAAALALEQIGPEAANSSQPLASLLMDRHEDPRVRAAAAQALGKLGVKDDIVVLALSTARVETDFQVVWAAQGGLNQLSIDTEAFVLALLNQVNNPEFAALAHDALIHVINTTEDAVDIIEDLYQLSFDKRISIVKQLASSYNTINPDKHSRVVKLLKSALLDEDRNIRFTAASSLVGIAGDVVELQEPLVALVIDQNQDLAMRQAAICALEWIAKPDSVVFVSLLDIAFDQDQDKEIRDTAVRAIALSSSHLPEDVLPLLASFSVLDSNQQWLIAPLIVAAGKELDQVIHELINLVIDGDDEACFFGIRCLSAIGSSAEAALPILLDIVLNSANEQLRTAAVRAIVQIGRNNEDIDIFLNRMSQDNNPDIQRIALQGIEKWKTVVPKQVLAFPTAQGFGAWTPGGRGGKVYIVTNLNDKGPGSLREAVEASGPRIVIFNVAGTIFLQSGLRIQNPYITIAGQTAPGDGVTIANYETSIETHDVIIRHLRFRLGDLYRSESDALGVNGGSNVIIDHVSASWGMDETLSVSESDNVTVQWCYITESMKNSYHSKGSHGYGSLVRGGYGGQYSLLNNLWAHHMGRMPRPGNYNSYLKDPDGLFVDFRNNVFYNWGGSTSGANNDSNSVTKYNFINNYYISGPNTSGLKAFREYSVKAQAYFAGNYMNGVEPADPWTLVDVKISRDIFETEYKQDKPFESGYVSTVAAEQAYQQVLEVAGAQPRDAIDLRVTQSVIERTGRHINSQIDVGSWLSIRLYPAFRDTNGDGIPDWWYVKYGFDPVLGLPLNQDLNGSGYTNIEEYLNNTHPDLYIDYINN